MRLFAFFLLFGAAFIIDARSAAPQAKPVILITAEEAKLELAPSSDLTFRAGVSRGPSITLVSPKSSESLQSPIRLQLKFEGRSGAQIDADSFKLIYAKKQAVDLTERVKPFVEAAGVDVPEAMVPPGTHTLRAEIRDKEGRAGSITFTLKMRN